MEQRSLGGMEHQLCECAINVDIGYQNENKEQFGWIRAYLATILGKPLNQLLSCVNNKQSVINIPTPFLDVWHILDYTWITRSTSKNLSPTPPLDIRVKFIIIIT